MKNIKEKYNKYLKTSFRFYNGKQVRSVWDDKTSSWWICAIDEVDAVVETKNPRVYWATIKRRNIQLFAKCKQLRLLASMAKSI